MNERKAALLLATLPTIALLFSMAGFGAGYALWGRAERRAELVKVRAALDHVQERYYADIPAGELVDRALEGFAFRLDPNCEYFTKQEWDEFNDAQLEGRFGGVGIVVEGDSETGLIRILTPIEETPAFSADILPGDFIREVDGKPIKGLTYQEVVRRIKGEKGTRVKLTLIRKGREAFTVTLTRAIIEIKAVKARMLEGGVGYIRITDFTKMMGQFDAEIARLQGLGMKALVIDLRFNGGGLLGECVKLADRFLEKGTIVSTRGRTDEDTRTLTAEKEGTLPPMPVAILVNRGTASASEVFAGALKDHGRAVLVGERTYGKGSVQTPFLLPDGSHFKITTARYFTPNGISVHREEGKKDFGLEPDHRVEMTLVEEQQLMKRWNDERIVKGDRPPEAPKAADLQLDAALEAIRAQLEGRPAKVQARILEKEKPSEN